MKIIKRDKSNTNNVVIYKKDIEIASLKRELEEQKERGIVKD